MIQALRNIFCSYIETTGKIQTIFVFFSAIITAGIATLEPLIFTKIISYIEEFYLSGKFDTTWAVKLILFWICFVIFSIIFAYLFRYFLLYKNNMKNYVLNCKKFNEKLVFMWYWEYLWKKQWSLYKIYDRGTQGQESFLYFFFWEVVRSLSSIVFIIIILFVTDYRMAILALSMIPVMLILWYFFVKRLSFAQKELNDKWDSMFWDIWNIFSSFFLTKILLIEKVFLRQMSGTLDDLLIEQNKLWKWWSFVNIYTSLLVMISRILVLSFGLYFVIDWSLSLASLFLVFSFIWWIYFPLSFLIDRLNEVVRHLTSVEKMYKELSDISPEDIDTWNIISNTKWNIEFQNVSFWYSTEKNILNNIIIKIDPGQKIALVWNTWAGKSTLVNLLLRFWEVDSGCICLDGINISDIKKSSLRSHIWVVSQDNSLFNLSIEENLRFAKPNATKLEITQALKKAQAEFVFDLDNGVKTVIWERWLKLSGWEKQRISIARLFLKNPAILILDEATSALDNVTEKKIEKALKKLMQWKTSIIIAHRLSTIRHADKIYMLENGKIVEQWNYEELMKKEKKFYNLANPEKLILW